MEVEEILITYFIAKYKLKFIDFVTLLLGKS